MSDENEGIEEEGEMSWDTEAREAVEGAAEHARLDEVRGVVYLMSGEDHRFNRFEEGFSDAESIRERLTEIGEDEFTAYVPFEGGEAVFPSSVDGYVEDVISRLKIEDFFDRLSAPKDSEPLILAKDLLPPGAGIQIQVDAEEINAELIQFLSKHPEHMREINPRKFEKLVAELYRNRGYEVEVTRRSKDGGYDIRLLSKAKLGKIITLVECKRYSPLNKVGVEIVRGLYGVVGIEGANRGIIATSSYFTKGAKSIQDRVSGQLYLQDFDELTKWLRRYQATP